MLANCSLMRRDPLERLELALSKDRNCEDRIFAEIKLALISLLNKIYRWRDLPRLLTLKIYLGLYMKKIKFLIVNQSEQGLNIFSKITPEA